MTKQAPDVEPYPSEIPKLKAAGEKLQRLFRNTVFNEKNMFEYCATADELFAEAGFRVGVNFDQGVHPITLEVITVPTVVVMGRIAPEAETDHDRLQHEITHGLVDGQPGYIRPDGTKREDPAKKLIV